MSIRWFRASWATAGSLALLATLLVSPAIADDPLDGLLDDSDTPADTPVVTEPEPAEPVEPDPAQDLVSGTKVGPVGVVDATYETVWAPNALMPQTVKAVNAGADVELVTIEIVGEAFLALLEIRSADAPTVYRFTDAVPEGHSAYVHADGSVRFVDFAGNETGGGIAVPWALDATGAAVATSFALDGTTLIQTVDHIGAAYPVVADPWWVVPLVREALRTAARYAPQAQRAASSCGAHCGAVVRGTASAAGAAARAAYNTAARVVPRSGDSNAPAGRPRRGCNVRSRRGC